MSETIEITPEIIARSDRTRAEFLVLGPATRRLSEPTIRRPLERRIRERIVRASTTSIADVWGTLGMARGGRLKWRGRIRFSVEGNEKSVPHQSTPATVNEIEAIRDLVGDGSTPIVERYISFEDIEFNESFARALTPDQLPRLRLTLMLRKDEGAVVYYQLHAAGTRRYDERVDEAAIDVIAPTEVRADRATYEFPLLPGRRFVERDGRLELTGPDLREHFVVKVLTFRRGVNKFRHHFFDHRHQLLEWQPALHAFTPPGRVPHGDEPTLLLIHGTASSTMVAFKGLIGSEWIAQQHAAAGGRYRQILAFDHPTFSEDAKDNVKALFDALPGGIRFTEPVDVITHSRGGLVAKYLALHEARRLPIRSGALVTCASGVRYFDKLGRNVSRLLSLLRLAAVANPVLLSAVQTGVKTFLDMPGSQLMTPGSDRLRKVLANPTSSTNTRFVPITGNRPRLDGNQKLLHRWLERGLDRIVALILGAEHDWVVGTDSQRIIAPAYRLPESPATVRTEHWNFFQRDDVQAKIDRALSRR